MVPRLTLSTQFSCFGLLSTRTIGECHHTQSPVVFDFRFAGSQNYFLKQATLHVSAFS